MKQAIYLRRVKRAGRTVDIEYTYPTQFGDGLTRRRASGKGTPLAMENYNREISIRRLGLLLNENFKPGDIWLTLHYERERRPKTVEEADRLFHKFFLKLKREFLKRNIEFKWVKPVTAVGERGAVHHHILIPQGVPQAAITDLWRTVTKSGCKVRPPDYTVLYETGEYSSLAAYIVRHYEKRNEECDKETPFYHPESNVAPKNVKNIKRWSCSRNLRKPIEESPKIVKDIKWQEPPVPWTGYYIETDSIRAGTNPVSGRPYLYYRQVKMPPIFVCYDDSGRKLSGEKAVKWYRQKNKKYLKEHWIDLAPEGEVIFKKELIGVKKNE